MYLKILFQFSFISLLATTALGQDTYMVVESDSNNKVLIRWLPPTPAAFDAGMASGYTLSRYDSTTKTSVVLAPQVLPKDSTWIMALMFKDTNLLTYYRSVYSWQQLPDMRTKALATTRYGLLMEEAYRYNEVSELMGLSFVDSTRGEAKRNYRYDLTLTSNPTKTIGQVSAPYEPLAYNESATPMPKRKVEGMPYLYQQRPDANRLNKGFIAMKSKMEGDSAVLLRWAPSNYALWAQGNKTGYQLFRYKILPSGARDKMVFRMDSLRPGSAEMFKNPEIAKDSATLIAAQVLYGKSMTVSGGEGIASKTNQNELRFGLALQAAEQSKLAAFLLGLGYRDAEIERGAQYYYEIISTADEILARTEIDTRSVDTARVIDFIAESKDHAIELSWSFENQWKFSSYKIMRAFGADTAFQELTKQPIMFALKGDEPTNFRYRFTDSVQENYKYSNYMIMGRDAFGDWSQPVMAIGQGKDQTPPTQPLITKYQSYQDYIEIEWKVDSVPPDLAGYRIYLSDNEKTGFKPLNTTLLPKNTRSFTYKTSVQTDTSYYFIVASVDTSKNEARSFAQYIPVIDSIAPVAPKKFTGVIDTNGVVHLQWAHNEEKDMAGYRVFIANSERSEFSQRLSNALDSNSFWDTLNINTLNRAIYYKILAEDGTGNKSEFSQVLKLMRPDKIPPTTPLMQQPVSSDDGVTLIWVPSSSLDVATHTIIRQRPEDSVWVTVATIPKKMPSTFQDTTVLIEQWYHYQLVATDSAGNKSPQSLTVTGRRSFGGKTSGIQYLKADVDAEKKKVALSWEVAKVSDPFLANKAYQIFVYRAKGTGQLEKYQQLEQKTPLFTDDEVGKGDYRYALRIAYEDGKLSPLTNEITVKID